MERRVTAGVCTLAFVAIAPQASAQPAPTVAPMAATDLSAQEQTATEQSSPAASGGKVIIRCTLASHYTLDACVVVREDPPNGGFGEMALSMSKEMRVQGPRGAVGATLTIPITFKPDRKRRGDGAKARPRLGATPIEVRSSEK